MKKTNSFEKFIPKKKNSAIKEEFRQQKRKWKKERAEAIEIKKAAKRKSAEAARPRAVGKGPVAEGKGAKTAGARHATQDSRLTTQDSRLKTQDSGLKTASRQSTDGDAPKTAPMIVRKKGAEEMPLNKYIAHCGVCSRRDAAELVKEGKINVNGMVITEPGFKVKTSDEVTMNKKKIFLAHNLVYILLNKPKDYITTAEDPQGRKTVLELVRGATGERIFPVGRLDRNTTGVLLLTNDGELTQKLSHPSYEVRKMYEVRLDKPLAKVDFDKILKGMTLEDGPVQVDALAFADPKDKSVIGIELHSGKNRIVRRIFEALGYDVRNLDRVMFANLTKKNVERGKWRFLKEKEVRLLKFMNSSFIRKNKKKDA
jgi:23S rRNA pseudouridine2605 synthase